MLSTRESQKSERRVYLRKEFLGLLLLCLATAGFAGDKGDKFDWKPFTPEELAMKDNPVSAGGSGLILDWEVFNNDVDNFQTVYYRIKVFSDAAKSEGNIEIPFVRETSKVTDIQARTIHADGTVIPFTGEIFEKTIVKTRQVRYLAKTFSLPDVQAGSILEYRYRISWDRYDLYDAHWDLQQKLPVRHAKFQLRPYVSSSYNLTWAGRGMPTGKEPVKGTDKTYSLELDNIPAFEEEAFAPPDGEIRARMDLFYSSTTFSDPDLFWKYIGGTWATVPEDVVGDRRYFREVAASLTQANDTPEAKLRKLYARAQQIRNLNYEVKRERLKDNHNIEDVIKHGYGSGRDINEVFLGLARAAGFEAHLVMLSSREKIFFRREIQDSRQLNWNAVEVKVADQYRYFDPGMNYCPFGMLHWSVTGVAGVRLQREGGALIITPNPTSNEAMIERKANFRWSEDGIKGEAIITYRGQEAFIKRLGGVNDDDNTRKKDLEDEVQGWLPEGSSAKLTSVTGWESTDGPLTASFSIELQNFGASTGQRLILPLDIFASHTHPAFQHDKRKYPVYFSYPYQEYDQISLEVPTGYQVEKLPTNSKEKSEYGRYASAWAQQGNVLTMQRRFAMDWFYFQPEQYAGLKEFFNKVHNSDQESAILHVQKQ
jgi:hypothetical protein